MPVLPVGQRRRLDTDLGPRGQNAAEGSLPLFYVDDLVVSCVDGVEHVLDYRVAGNWVFREAAKLTDELVEVQEAHVAVLRGIELES